MVRAPRPKTSILALGALSLCLLAACHGHSTTAPTFSPTPAGYIDETEPTGLEGVVLRGPVCPVESDAEPCPDEPFSAIFHVFDIKWSGVSKFQTTEAGWFHLNLPPGDYIIEPDLSAPLMPPPTAHRVLVTVPESGFATVTLSFDTGIR
jgi:hypothetical protein